MQFQSQLVPIPSPSQRDAHSAWLRTNTGDIARAARLRYGIPEPGSLATAPVFTTAQFQALTASGQVPLWYRIVDPPAKKSAPRAYGGFGYRR